MQGWPLVGRPLSAGWPLTTDSQGRIQSRVTRRKARVGVVTGLVIVVLHIEVAQLAVFNA